MSSYSPHYPVWEDDPDTDTPITAAALNNMEAGIIAANTPEGGVDYIGDWSAATPYTQGDVVKHEGIEYVAVNPSTGQEPVAPGVPEIPPPPGAPAGAVLAFAGATPPVGFLLCDGAAVSRSTYAALFAVIGTTYGIGDGSTTFQLPDMRGRAPFGVGTHAWVDALGENDGVTLASRGPQHQHSVNDPTHAHGITDPGHAHTLRQGPNSVDQGIPTRQSGPHDANNANVNANTTGITINGASTGITVGPAGAQTDHVSYLVLNYIIKT